ncbi:hypothetical protein [Magnetospirillum sp. UT-4]|uniref:hypothetical protein n=1 Tax=Magnetospirillum sp. UT-4 TaxID=2681467 RepID=UPI0013804799|nr:hypothetical protein [Magnetospirillum sp. UT-4]CAA7616905.1 exported hypothetical protein [Magnetospirillum sp. UT-4]
MGLVGFFGFLAAIFLIGGLAKGAVAWLLVGGALAIATMLLGVLRLTKLWVDRSRR